MQTVGGKQGKPHTGKQGQMDLDQKDYYRQTKYIVKYIARNYLVLKTAQTYD